MDRFRSIYELCQKIKSFSQIFDRRELYTCLVVLCVAVSSFCLGRFSLLEASKPKISINMCDLSPQIAFSQHETNPPKDEAALAQKGQFVGSKSSNKYHLPECSGAKRITSANKIWFQSREEAEKAGYSPAGNCPVI
jgi:hypothetical protein